MTTRLSYHWFFVSFMVASTSHAEVPTRPAQSSAPTALPVPRAAFIVDMDTEFKKLDANGDGVVTRTEIEAAGARALAASAAQRSAALFSKIDTDHNGQISPEEFARATAQSPGKFDSAPLLARFDTNHDGSISLVEYRTATLANFDKMDTDKDGVVSVAEQRAAGVVK